VVSVRVYIVWECGKEKTGDETRGNRIVGEGHNSLILLASSCVQGYINLFTWLSKLLNLFVLSCELTLMASILVIILLIPLQS
jgi:hypothetical protein